MGEIKPLGSEKLAGNEKLRRILELTYYNENKNITESTQKAEVLKETKSGVYGIVKEKDGYYVKQGLNESSLDYIGGLFMKNKNKFSSYAEALKRMELISSPDTLNEEKKYVLKNPNAAAPQATEAPAAAPAVPDASTAPAAVPPPPPSSDTADTIPAAPTSGEDDMPTPSSDEPSMGDDAASAEPSDDAEGTEAGPEHMKEIQRLCGKLGQAIREVKDKMEGDDVKYVINMILSAVDIDKLDEADKEEMAKKFEPEEGSEEPTGEEPSADETGEEPSADETAPEPEPGANPMGQDSEMDENMSKLEELINTDFNEGHEEPMDDWGLDDNEDEEKHKDDLDIAPELSGAINEAISTTLSKYFE
jgi:hypothetical protein